MAIIPMPSNDHMPAVPLVGQRLVVHECQPIVTVTCTCRPNNQAFLITGVDVVKVCAFCQERFAVVRVAYERGTTTTVHATVACLGKHSA